MKIKLALIAVVIFNIFFCLPFLNKGYFPTQDGEWAIVRLTEMTREIRDLQFPPRWSDFLNHGYGYPLFLYTYPLPYYMGSLIHLLGISFISTIKVLFVSSMVLGSLGFYFFSKKYWGNYGGIICSIFYSTFPYRLINLYVRGSLGESIALAIFPWLLWFYDRYIDNPKKSSLFPSLFFTLLVISHNVSFLILTTFLICFLFFKMYRSNLSFIRVFIPMFEGLLLTSYFWIPIAFEKKFIVLSIMPLADKSLHFINIKDLLGLNTQQSIKPPLFLGYPQILLIPYSVFLLFKKKVLEQGVILKFYLVTLLITLLFSTSFFSFIWNLPLLNSVDFPWRLMVLISILISFVAGSLIYLKHSKIFFFFFILIFIYFSLPLIQIKNYLPNDDQYYVTNDATTTSNDELMPIWVTIKPKNRPENKVILTNGEIKDLTYTSRMIEFTANVNAADTVIINSLYFPGWKYKIDNKDINVQIIPNNGTIGIPLSPGNYKVKGTFSRTYVRLVSDIISVITVGYFLIKGINRIRVKYK